MNDEQFRARITALRNFGPTWANLRVIGNSRPVQIATVFPVVGYFILLSTQVTQFIDGGIAGQAEHTDLTARLWSMKLYFLYFGLIALGVGSAIYQWRCPRLVKSFADNDEYVRMQGQAISADQLRFMARETVTPEFDIDEEADSDLVIGHPRHRVPIMINYYALESAGRPLSRMFTTACFVIGFALLAVPSIMTFCKVIYRLF